MKVTIRNPFMTLILLVTTFLFPKIASASGWTVDPAAYRYDMSLYFELSFTASDAANESSDYEIGAFVGDECRGIAEKMADVDDCLYMRIRSNSSSEEITFKLRNKSTGTVTDVENVSIPFESGKVIGLPSNPYKLVVINYYDVQITASEGGSVDSSNGRYAEGTVINVTATPDEGYEFSNWSDGITESERTLTVNGNVTLEALFKRNVFTLTFIVDGETFQSINLKEGESIEAPEAPAKDGYKFVMWENLPEIMPAEDVTVTAIYDRYFNVTITASEGGAVNKVTGSYKEGSEITIIATANNGYRFVKWSDDITEPERTITVSSTINLEAIFTKDIFTLTYIVDGEVFKTEEIKEGSKVVAPEAPDKEGYKFAMWENLPETMPAEDVTVTAVYDKYFSVTVTASEGGAVNDVSGSYKDGSEITITATASDGYRFVKWSDDVTEPQRTITVTSDIALEAIFEEDTYTVSFVVDGEVIASEKIVVGARVVAPDAPEKEGYRFVAWENLPETMPAEDVTVTAVYDRYFNVTVTASEGGSVNDVTGSYKDGSEITITATASDGYRFVKWSDDATEPQRTITVTSDIALEAIFEEDTYTVSFVVDGEVIASEKIVVGAKVVAPEAPEKEGYRFVAWENLPETMPAEDVTVTAIYDRYFNVTVTASEGGAVNDVTGSYKDGSEITITATANDGYRFVKWSDDATEPQRTITVTSDIALEAIFEEDTYTVSFVVDGEVIASEKIVVGAKVVAPEAPEKEGYRFVAWENLPETMPAEDVTVTALYDRYFSVTVTASEGGSVNDVTGSYKDGSEITLIATPDYGYKFVEWSDGNTESTRSITVDADISIEAIFTKNIFTIYYMVDDQDYKTVELIEGSVIEPEYAPEKEGYTFNGWEGLPEIMPAANVVATAVYTANVYTLSVFLDGELYFETQLHMGEEINIPTPELPSNKIFEGWTEEVPETMPAHNLVINGTTKTLSGIHSISIDENTSVSIYSLNGALLLKDVTLGEAAERLPHGIYIVNGIKIAL